MDAKLDTVKLNAKHFLALGICPYVDASEFPFEHASGVETGCSYRSGICTSYQFKASFHGVKILTFFDIEGREANGSSTYHIRASEIGELLQRLPKQVADDFRDLLRGAVASVRKRAEEYQQAAVTQFGLAASLAMLTDKKEIPGNE